MRPDRPVPSGCGQNARLRCRGTGTIQLADFGLRPAEVDTYRTGVLVSQLHQRRRMGILLESNFGIVNRDLVSRADRDNDGRWSLVTIDLDQLTAPAKRGDDWRSNFEDNPNVILWSDGAVL